MAAEASTLIDVPPCGVGSGVIRLTEEHICVHVLDGVHFDFDYCFVRPEGRVAIREIVTAVNQASDRQLLIVGHTDRSGLNAYNIALSRRRARSVLAYVRQNVDGWMDLLRTMMSSPGSDTTPRSGTGQSYDRWQTREIQYMLSAIQRPGSSATYYDGPIDNIMGSGTRTGLDAFRADVGLPAGGGSGTRWAGVDEETWRALFERYMTQDAEAIPPERFLPPELLGCGEQYPRIETRAPGTESLDLVDAEARSETNRRVEFLLIPAALVPASVTCAALYEQPMVICPEDPQPIAATFKFYDGDGSRPYPNLDVDIAGQGGFTRRRTTSEQGTILLDDITQGDYRLTVANDLNLELRTAGLGTARGNEASVRLKQSTVAELEAARLSQTITLRIELQNEWGQPYVGPFDLTLPGGEVLAGETTDATGRWERAGMATGAYTVTIADQFVSLVE